MKNWKQNKFVCFFSIIAFTFITCNDNNEIPKNQSATITGLFDNNSTAIVKGYLTDAEWNGVTEKIKNALNVRFEMSGSVAKNSYKDVFSRGVIIILEKTSEYTKFKTIGDEKTMYINFNILNNTETLGSALNSARLALTGAEVPTME